MKILLACNAGMSTTTLESAMQRYMKAHEIEGEVIAYSAEKAKKIMNEYDIVLLGPQVRYMFKSFQSRSKNTPVLVIEPMDYALAKAGNILKIINKTLNK